MFNNFGFGGKAKTIFQTGYLAGLDFVQVMVATQQQQPDLRGRIILLYRQHNRLDRLLQRHTQEIGHLFAFGFAGCRGLGQGLTWCSALR